MRNSSRRFLVLMIVAPALFVAAGCRNAPEDVNGRVTITFWHSFVASSIPSLEGLLKEFERDNPGIHIQAQYVPTGDALGQKLVASIQSRTAPDVSWIHSDFLSMLVEADAVFPIEHFLVGPDTTWRDSLGDIFPALLSGCRLGDTLYSLPMEATSLALLFNKDAFHAAGLDPERPPADWSELIKDTRQLTVDRDGDGKIDQYGFFVPVFPASGDLNIWMNLQWLPFLWQAGGREFTDDLRRSTFNSEAGVKALAVWKTLYDLEDFSRFALAHDLAFASGKVAMILDGPWNLPRYRAIQGMRWAVAPLPAGPEGAATYLDGEQLVIFKQSKHADAAWTFVKWILRPDVQARFSMQSGYLPVRRATLDLSEYKAFLASDPALKAFVDQMPVGRSRRITPQHQLEINRALAEAIEQATLGKQDPKACLDRAAIKVERYLP